eukprot:NODE_25892_length_572_cov_1.687640.p7 GENE.NODE_25892_length_572_cov_1.687640~~NODE_25892_length_572_cov_1.687640.p7  ORF type:complete len:54 (-),score=12.51 NODE_25892_length_572_cov_1.687640:150-311(-)
MLLRGSNQFCIHSLPGWSVCGLGTGTADAEACRLINEFLKKNGWPELVKQTNS